MYLNELFGPSSLWEFLDWSKPGRGEYVISFDPVQGTSDRISARLHHNAKFSSSTIFVTKMDASEYFNAVGPGKNYTFPIGNLSISEVAEQFEPVHYSNDTNQTFGEVNATFHGSGCYLAYDKPLMNYTESLRSANSDMSSVDEEEEVEIPHYCEGDINDVFGPDTESSDSDDELKTCDGSHGSDETHNGQCHINLDGSDGEGEDGDYSYEEDVSNGTTDASDGDDEDDHDDDGDDVFMEETHDEHHEAEPNEDVNGEDSGSDREHSDSDDHEADDVDEDTSFGSSPPTKDPSSELQAVRQKCTKRSDCPRGSYCIDFLGFGGDSPYCFKVDLTALYASTAS